ncbi:MAG: PAS domain S-box protein, partial [Nitrospirota bacterium]
MATKKLKTKQKPRGKARSTNANKERFRTSRNDKLTSGYGFDNDGISKAKAKTKSEKAIRLKSLDERRLRKAAEKLLRSGKSSVKKERDAFRMLAEKDLSELVHELQVHQAELEMQNEELRRAQDDLIASQRKYADLYDFAPVGYMTLDRRGTIGEANLTAARMFGVGRRLLTKRPFVLHVADSKEQFFSHLKNVFETGEKQTCRLVIKKKGGGFFHANLESVLFKDSAGKNNVCRTVVSDITSVVKAEEALRESEEKFKTIFDGSIDGILVADVENKKFLMGNKAICNMLGYSQDEIKNLSVPDIHPQENLPFIEKQFEIMARGEAISNENIPVKRKDGGIFYVDIRATHIQLSGRKYIVGSFRDITERRRSEEVLEAKEAELRLIADTTPVLLTRLSRDLRYVFVNQACCEWFGRTREEIVGKHVAEIMGVRALDVIRPHIEKVLRGERVEYEAEIPYQGIGSRFMHVAYVPERNAQGDVVGWVASVQDITERKQAEEALRESHERAEWMARFPEENPNPVLRVTHEGVVLYCNAASARLSGWECEVGGPLPDSLLPLSGQAMAQARHVRQDLQMDGQFYDVTVVPFPRENYANIYGRDITERKKKETELAKLNRMLAALGRSSQVMMRAESESEYLKEVCRIIVEDCGHAMVWIGFAEDDENKTVRPVASAGFEEGYLDTLKITWADKERGRGPTGTAIRTGRPSMCKNMLTDPAFKPWRQEAVKRGYASSAVIPIMAGDKAVGAINIYSREPDPFSEDEVKLLSDLADDLSYGISSIRLKAAQAQAEEAMRQSEERLRMALKAGDVFAFEWNPLTDEIIRSESCATILGVPAEDAVREAGKEYFRRIYPEDRDKFIALLNSLCPNAPFYEVTYRLMRPDGAVVILEETARGQFDSEGRLVRLYGMAADVTEREMALKLLRESEQALRISRDELGTKVRERTAELSRVNELLERMFSNIHVLVAYMDKDFNFIRVNKAYADADEKLPDFFPGRNHFELYPNVENEMIFKRVVETGDPYIVHERPFVYADNPERGVTYWDWSLVPVKDIEGRVSGIILSLLNVTDRKLAQDALQLERNRLQSILNTMPDGIIIIDRNFDIRYVNPSLERDFGPVEGRKCHEYFHNLPRSCSWCRNEEVFEGKSVFEEWQYGRTGRTYELLASPFINDDGSISKMQIFHDITERKRAEEELIVSREKLVDTLESIRDGFFSLDREWRFAYVNSEAVRLFRRKREELLGRSIWEISPEAVATIIYEEYHRAMAEQEPVTFETLSLLPDTWVEVVAYPSKDGLSVYFHDISERKRAAEALLASEEKYRSLIEQASDAIVLFDRELNIVDANPMACRISGYSRDELIKLNAMDLLPPEDLATNALQLDRVLAGETVVNERRMVRKDGSRVEIEVSGKMLEDGRIQVIGRDITDRKTAENRDHLISGLLGLFIRKTTRKAYIEAAVELIRQWSGLRCVGVRVADEHGNIPYEAYAGFDDEFMRKENMLSLKTDVCACIRIIAGTPEPQDMAFVTERGSIRINDSPLFANSLNEKELARFRGNCIKSGFATIGIVPVRYLGKALGAIHLADERPNMLPLKFVEFMESTIAPLIGEAIHRFDTEEVLRKIGASLNEAQRIARIGNWEWDIETDRLFWSEEIYRIFGVGDGWFKPTYEEFLNFVHPEDRDSLQMAVNEAAYE